MTEQHPITPPRELVQQWLENSPEDDELGIAGYIATQAARWGADQELKACCDWMSNRSSLTEQLRAARRPPAIPETVEVDGHTYRLVK